MSLTKEEFDKRLDKTIESSRRPCYYCGFGEIIDEDSFKQSLRQLILDVTGDPAEDCDFCG